MASFSNWVGPKANRFYPSLPITSQANYHCLWRHRVAKPSIAPRTSGYRACSLTHPSKVDSQWLVVECRAAYRLKHQGRADLQSCARWNALPYPVVPLRRIRMTHCHHQYTRALAIDRCELQTWDSDRASHLGPNKTYQMFPQAKRGTPTYDQLDYAMSGERRHKLWGMRRRN
jgi:hypothetical protein